MTEEYDFSHGVRGAYAKRYAAGHRVIVILPDGTEEVREEEPATGTDSPVAKTPRK